MSESRLTKAIDEALTREYLDLVPPVANHEFSRKFERQMSKLVRHRDSPYYGLTNTTRKRVATLVALSVLLSTITVMDVDALRDKVVELIVTTFEKFSTVRYSTHSAEYPTSIERVYSIGYDLSGYTIDYEYTDTTTHNVVYSNGSTVIDFSQYVKAYYDVDYNTEDAQVENITVNGWDGIYFMDNHDHSSIILDTDDYIVTICANVPKSQLLDIANTVRYVE